MDQVAGFLNFIRVSGVACDRKVNQAIFQVEPKPGARLRDTRRSSRISQTAKFSTRISGQLKALESLQIGRNRRRQRRATSAGDDVQNTGRAGWTPARDRLFECRAVTGLPCADLDERHRAGCDRWNCPRCEWRREISRCRARSERHGRTHRCKGVTTQRTGQCHQTARFEMPFGLAPPSRTALPPQNK